MVQKLLRIVVLHFHHRSRLNRKRLIKQHQVLLGFVENYSYLECPDCGKKIQVFGKSHLDEIAAEFGLPVLARLPIDPKVAEAYDSGLMETVNTDNVAGVIEVIENVE